jgi:hypothetical protein
MSRTFPRNMQIIASLVVVIIGLGAWRSWRRRPVYSLKTNLQLAGVFLLMITAILAVTFGVVQGRSLQSSNFRAVLTVLTGLLVLTGFMSLAFRITEARLRLPQGAKICDLHRRRLLPWIRSTGILLVFTSTGSMLAPERWSAAPLVLGAMVMLVAAAVLYPMYLQARRFDRSVTSLVQDPWVHWKYPAEQWQTWASIQRSWDRAQTPVFRLRRDWSKLLFPVAVFGIGARVLGTSGTDRIIVAATCVAILFGVTAFLTGLARHQPERRYRRMLSSRPEAFLGAEGLYCSGEYAPWHMGSSSLLEATAVLEPPVRLVLSFSNTSRSGSNQVTRLIPIPEGSEGDVERLQHVLRSICPAASVQLAVPESKQS